MRKLLFGLLLCIIPRPTAAQQLATVALEARVRVPDFMSMEKGGTTEANKAAGLKQRLVTLYVTANRTWDVSAVRQCQAQCSNVEIKVVQNSTGRSGNRIPVVVELTWPANETAPQETEFHYVLAPQ